MYQASRVFLAALVVGMLVSVGTPTVADATEVAGAGGWLSYGNGPTNQRTNANPTIGPAQAKTLKEVWNSNTTAGVEITTSAVVTSGVVYAGCGFGICAVNTRTGTLVWKFATPGQVDASPVLSNGVLYIGDQEVGGSSNMYAVSAVTGTEIWHTPIPGFILAGANVVNGVVYSSNQVSGHAIGGLAAFNAKTGVGGVVGLAGNGGSTSTPAISNGLAYIYGAGSLWAFNASTGKEVWRRLGTAGSNESALVANGAVYVGNPKALWAFDASTGTTRWTVSDPGGLTSPAFANNVLYVGNIAEGAVYAYNATTGHQLWRTTVSGTVSGSPTLANGVVYFGSYEYPKNQHPHYNLNAVDASTGAMLWHQATPGTLTFFASPSVANGVICYGSYAFGL